MSRFDAKVVFIAFLTAILILFVNHSTNARQNQKPSKGVQVIRKDAEKRVDILVDGEPFTSYLYADTIPVLKKTVLYPLRTGKGTIITRGFPLAPRPGERVDHPHQIGGWFNYGDVNGLDFWNNSNAIPPERAHEMGTIRHRSINHIESGANTGTLDVTIDWRKADGKPILREDTRFMFHSGQNLRAIDRITTLTALDERVLFKDNKEGMMAIRVARALEHPSDEPLELTDASGKVTKVPVMDNTGVTGMYTNSEGITGTDAWGKRASWVMLSGIVEGDSVTLAIFDHPKNVGYPSYWHARGYGLFAANPLGQKIFSGGKEELNFALEAGASTTFRYRVLIQSGFVTREQMAKKYREFISKDESNQENGKSALEKFQDMKFGMFIHWGIYAVPAGEWKGEYVRGIGEWIMNHKRIPAKEYEKLAEQFNPVNFNADEWSQLAQDAGMKYMVITSKHHDGFAMYHSKVSDYNIVDRTPFKRDPMKELAAANAKRGIKFGFYYSQAQDWHEPNAAGNTWDFPEQRDPKPYVEGKALPQVEELLRNYGDLALIWFDTPRLLTQEQALSLKQKVKELQPNCLVNNRIGFNLGDYYQTGDNAIPTMVYDWKAWEIPATLNDTWGYKKNDHNWKDPHDLIYKLTDIVSKGGNYLLNVGPTAEGVIPAESQKILRTIGKWMQTNGEAIYAANHTPLFYPAITWKCTAKPGKLYFHIVNWPGTKLEIIGIESKVKQAYLLANKQKVKFEQKGNKLSISLPAQPLDPYNTIIAVEINDEKAKITSGYGYRDEQKTINLYALDARLRGEEARYDWKSQSASGFVKAENPKNELWWYHHPFANGVYHIALEYACANDIAGSEFYFYNMKEEQNKFTGTIQATNGEFKLFGLTNVKLTANEENRLIFGLSDDDKSANVRVRRIILTKEENKP